MLLPDTLVQLFRTDAGGDDRDEAARRWMRALHAAFYAPVSVRGAPGNKFLELEAAVVAVVTRLAGEAQADDVLWAFMLRVLLLLSQEPKLSPPESDEGASSSHTPPQVTQLALVELSGLKPKKLKTKKPKSAQPLAPLAFVVVNALRKLSQPSEESGNNNAPAFAAHVRRLGETSVELHTFCQRGLENPRDVDQKLLVELLDLFQLVHFDVSLLLAAGDHLVVSKSYSALIKLVVLFRDLNWPLESMVRAAAQGKDWVSAELLVRNGSRGGNDTELAKVLVEEAVALRDFKRAHRLVHTFALQQEYPDIETMYSRDSLLKLIEKRKWQLALTFVGNDAALKRILFDHVVAAGEVAHAVHLAESLGITDYTPGAAQLAAQQSAAAATKVSDVGSSKYLSLPLPSDAVVFCSEERQIREAYTFFFEPVECKENAMDGDSHVANGVSRSLGFHPTCIVGLDVEWKPATSRVSNQTFASILQIATSTRVFVIDLLALHNNALLLEEFLPRLLLSQQYLKVGFGFDSDMKVLHQTFPERSTFLRVSPFLELSSLVLKSFGASAGKSLSSAASRVLGKPLDKSMQLSDWDARPLSVSQMEYAALDAHCLVQIVREMTDDVLSSSKRSEEPTPAFAGVDPVDHVALLENTAVVSSETAAELTRLRREYVESWQRELPRGLLTAEDVLRFWERRREEYLASADAEESGLALDIKFLSAAAVNELLVEQQSNSSTNFTHINSICFFADGEPYVACIDAALRLDTAELARVCGVGRRKLKLATPHECRNVFGFLPGTVPPFGHRGSGSGCNPFHSPIKVLADASLLRSTEYFVGGGGSPDAFLWMSAKAFFRVLDVEPVASISAGSWSSLAAEVATSSSPSSDGAYAEHAHDIGITDSKAEAPALKFVADTMASQVARWLRTIGVDVVTWDADKHSDSSSPVGGRGSQSHRAKLLAFAAREHRIILTRDTQLASRRDAGACVVLSSDVCYKQFREVKSQFGLYARKDGSVSRCARCNATEFVTVSEEYARNRLRKHTRITPVLGRVSNYWMCVACKKIYWEGPKYTTTGTVADGEVMYQPQERQRRTRKPTHP